MAVFSSWRTHANLARPGVGQPPHAWGRPRRFQGPIEGPLPSPLEGWSARYCGAPRGSGAAVAHHLAKVRVAGSNPVFRSNKTPGRGGFRGLRQTSSFLQATNSLYYRPHGGAWKAFKDSKIQVIASPPAARKWRCVPARGRRLEGRHRASSRLRNRSTSPAVSHHTRDARRSRARTVSAEDGRGSEAAADRWDQCKVRGGGDESIPECCSLWLAGTGS